MADFLRSFERRFTPAFGQMYQRGFESAEEEAVRQAKLDEKAQQQQGLRDLLGASNITPEEVGIRFSQLGQPEQRAYSLFQKMKAPKEVKYSNVFREGNKQFGLNEQGERVEIGGAPLPEEEPTYIYDPNLPNVMKQDPRTKQLIPTDIINPKYKKPTFEKEVRGKYDPTTDTIPVEVQTYEKGGTEPIKSVIKHLSVKESGIGGNKLKKEALADLDQQEKEIIALKNRISNKVSGVKVGEDESLYIDTPKGRIPLTQYQSDIKNELWKRSDSFTSEIKNMLSDKGKKFLRELYGTEIKEKGKVVKGKNQKPNLSDFSSSLADWWKNGEIDEADYKLLKYYRTGTYHGIEE